jgi:hypothetical protein
MQARRAILLFNTTVQSGDAKGRPVYAHFGCRLRRRWIHLLVTPLSPYNCTMAD